MSENGESNSRDYKKINDPDTCLVKDHVVGGEVTMLVIHSNSVQVLHNLEIDDDDTTVQQLINEVTKSTPQHMRIYVSVEPEAKYNYVIDLRGQIENATDADYRMSSKICDPIASDSRVGSAEEEEKLENDSKMHTDQNQQEEKLCEDEDEGDDSLINVHLPYTDLYCRAVLIGSYIYVPEETVIMSRSGLHLRVPLPKDDSNIVLIEVKFEDIVRVGFNFRELLPVLIFYIKSDASLEISKSLEMQERTGPFFHTAHLDHNVNRLIIVANYLSKESEQVIRTILSPNDLLREFTDEYVERVLHYLLPRNIWLDIKTLLKNINATFRNAVKPKIQISAIQLPEISLGDEKVALIQKTEELHNDAENSLHKSEDYIGTKQLVNKASKRHVERTTAPATVLSEDNIGSKQLVNKASKRHVEKTTAPATVLSEDNIGTIQLVNKASKRRLNRTTVSASVVEPVKERIEILSIYPRQPTQDRLTISTRDYDCLSGKEYISDGIIDFYLKYLTLHVLSKEDRDRSHVFSALFYLRLTSSNLLLRNTNMSLSPAEERHANVRKWSKHVNIFDKDFIIIPIVEHSHWYLAIICFPGLVAKIQGSRTTSDNNEIPTTIYKHRKAKEMRLHTIVTSNQKEIKKKPCILIFNSLSGYIRNGEAVLAILRDYLSCEHAAKFGTKINFTENTIQGDFPKVPQQTNYTDCGLFVLEYFENFFSNPIRDYTLPLPTLRNWFDRDAVTHKRKHILNLIHNSTKIHNNS